MFVNGKLLVFRDVEGKTYALDHYHGKMRAFKESEEGSRRKLKLWYSVPLDRVEEGRQVSWKGELLGTIVSVSA